MQAANAVQFNPVEIKLNVSRATFPTEAPKAARLGEMVCRRLSPNQGSPGGAEHTQLAPGPGTALGTPNRTSGPGRVMLCEGHLTMFAPGSHSAVAAKSGTGQTSRIRIVRVTFVHPSVPDSCTAAKTYLLPLA
jgi:hypothetical protein